MGKSKPQAPAAPDYAGAAVAQGKANQDAALQSTYLSNPNIYSPYGNQTVSYSTVYDAYGRPQMQPTVTQSLTPEAQAALNAQQQVQMQQAQLAQQGMSQASNILSQPFQYNGPDIQTSFGGYNPAGGLTGNYGQAQTSLGNYGNIQNNLDLSQVANLPVNAGVTGQQAIMSRLQPQIDQSNAAFQQQMANQGITAGGEAYNNAFRNQSQSTNDLQTQAALYGLGLDFQANQQGFNNALQSGQFANNAQQQAYQQALGAGQFYNQGQQQNYDQAFQGQQLYNQAQAQNYNMAQGQAQFANEASNQLLQRQLGLYNQPLNQVTALMSGSQIQNPQFQQYTGANIEAAPIANATSQLGQYNQGIYGQQMAGYNAQMGALGSALGGITGMATKPSLGLFGNQLWG